MAVVCWTGEGSGLTAGGGGADGGCVGATIAGALAGLFAFVGLATGLERKSKKVPSNKSTAAAATATCIGLILTRCRTEVVR